MISKFVFYSSIFHLYSISIQRRTNLARHLYLIRHGQYFDSVQLSEEMKLTALGQEQVKYTGQRLNQMNITFDRLIHSTMVRARESAQIINEQFYRKLPLIVDANLIEGIPIAPSPYAGISQNYVDVRYSIELSIECVHFND